LYPLPSGGPGYGVRSGITIIKEGACTGNSSQRRGWHRPIKLMEERIWKGRNAYILEVEVGHHHLCSEWQVKNVLDVIALDNNPT